MITIKLEGSGTLDQIAVRLIEIGRDLQVASVYSMPVKEVENDGSDGCLSVTIKAK